MGFRGQMVAAGKVQRAELSAIVTRADGTVEDLGTIAFYHRNPAVRALWHLGRILRLHR